jgi:Ferritin-like domain
METTEKQTAVEEQNKSGRRKAILMGGAALASLAFGKYAAAQSAVTDTDILNFALNLEYLEAQFYTLATQGTTIDQVGVSVTGGDGSAGGSVTVKSNPKVPFTTPLLQQYAMETAVEERNHVSFLRTALAASAVAQPNLDLLNSFNALAVAAGLGASFDPFANETNFLLGAFIFEDVGVTAYHGAAGLISDATYLDKAAGILAVEAYHAGSIRTRIFAAGTAAQQAASLIAAARASLDGTGNDDVGVGVVNGAATIVDADADAIAFSRSTAQVLKIVYGGGSTSGAFFPNGLNGTIK